MKTALLSSVASLVLSASAVPTAAPIAAAAPGGIDLANALQNGRVQLSLNIDLGQGGATAAAADAFDANQIFAFTSMHLVSATPEQVVNDTTPTGGITGASGNFNFGINSAMNMICYNITLNGFQGDFESPATTATHIHEAALGASGPPRIAFPNPEPVNGDVAVRNSAGCIKGPFTTGVMVEGKDSGEGFHVSMIEANPAAFMADTHSSVALPGAVRGQLA